ncbi:hypothetical protein WBG78_26615 [Chryseolinea sp. T2]|uniref:hypothetical protein n=1 Tax=Chryseolinea sp. T2 TaxID=3129255 RepID=UPI00307894E9
MLRVLNKKALILILTLCHYSFDTFAQWSTSGSNIYSSNSGNIGIGTTAPERKLHVYGQAMFQNPDGNGSVIISGNPWYTQFISDRLAFYINKELQVDGPIKSYGRPLELYAQNTLGLTMSNTSGYVGLGTSSPASRLHISGAVVVDDVAPTLFTGSGSSELSRYVHIKNSPQTSLTAGLKAGGLLISDEYSYANPAKNDLIVKGKTGLGATNLTENVKLAIATSDWHIKLSNSDPGGVDWRLGSTSNSWATGGGKFIISSNNVPTSASLVIDQSKNVGIGTISPVDKLHIVGNMVLDTSSPTLYTSSSTSDQNRFIHLRNSPTQTAVSGLKAGGILVADSYDYGSPGKNDIIVKGRVGIGTPLTSNPNNYSLLVNGTVNATAVYMNDELVRSSQWTTNNGAIHYGNSVGIGTSLTTNPNSYKLAVNGKIGAHEVRVEKSSTTWPDYVFAQDYELPPLNDIEKYIRTYRHLPEVPTQKVIEADGHDLGSMDAILLKKIEELTLYIIQQEKRMVSQEEELRKLKESLRK